MDKICVVGLGYIGLPTAVTLAAHNFQVIGLDINQSAVDKINSGVAHIVEPDLDHLLQTAVQSKALQAKTQLTQKDADASVYVIAVPTPFVENKKPDISYIRSAINAISSNLKKGDLLILESTSPVGTTATIAEWLRELRPDLSIPIEDSADNFDLCIAYCPERVLPGKVLHELIYNNRIIGGLTSVCADRAASFYRQFVKGECLKTRARVAAMSKLTENAFRDVNIAFANELSMICDDLNIDALEMIRLANHHPRVNILKPGPGVGGHCIAVDPWFIVDKSPEKAKLIRQARETNDCKPHYLVSQVERQLSAVKQPTVLCLGLAYKPNIDDLRESPAIEVVKLLAKNSHYQLTVVEPHVNQLPKALVGYPNIQFSSLDETMDKNYNLSLKLVEHSVFEEMREAIAC